MGNNNGSIKRILIFGNGELHKKLLREVHAGDYVIGVDRAAFWLLVHGVTPDAAIGDFDSTTKKELKLIEKSIKIIKYFPRKKDRTDMELAMSYADTLTHSEIFVFGATGKRLDHLLGILHMIRHHVVIDEYNRVRLIGRGKTILKRSSYRYISILPYTKSIAVSLMGFKYNLDRKILKKESSLGISNEIIGKKAVITIFSGKAWVIESND